MIDQAESFVRSRGLGVESELSVLKRRRDLAYLLPSFADSYLEGALGCSARFPHSDLAAARCGEAAWMRGPKLRRLREHAAGWTGAPSAPSGPSPRRASAPFPALVAAFPGVLLAAADAYAVMTRPLAVDRRISRCSPETP
jgi:hypothetical protein